MHCQQHLIYILWVFFLCFKTVSPNAQYISSIEVYPKTTTIAEGDSHILNCNVTGGSAPEISWYFKGQKLSTETTNNPPNQYTVMSFSASDEGQYHCAAENSRGKIVSSSITLKLAYFNVGVLPGNLILSPNTSFVIQCPLHAVDSFPPPSVTWLFNSVQIQIAYPLVVTLEYELVFSLVRSTDTGLYSCRVANSFLNASHDIPVAAISQPMQIINTDAKYVVAPRNRTVDEGDDVSFQCIIVGSSSASPAVWRFDGIILTISERISIYQNTAFLTIKNVQLEDTGSYSCNDAGDQLEQKPFTLTVIAPPVIIDNQNPFLEPLHGSNLSISCQSEGTVPLYYSWLYNGAPLDNSMAFYSEDPARRDEIELHSLVPSGDGIYQCFVKNSAGEDTRTFHVTVQVKPPELITSQRDILAFVGGNFIFGCLATESSLSVYTYTRNNLPLPSNGYLKHNETHYQVIGATKSQSGNYACNISNSFGSVYHMFTVKVINTTEKNTTEADSPITSFSNETVLVRCRGTVDDSYPSLILSYRWEFNGVPILVSQGGRFHLTGNHGDLQITDVQPNDTGNFSCIAITSDANLVNATSLETRIESVTLLVANTPSPPTNVTSTLTGNTVSISWSAPTDDGGVSIERYEVEYRIEDQQGWRGAGESGLDFITFSVCPSSTYVFRVLAVNMVGPSDYSESTSIATPGKVPSVFPVNVSVQAATDSSRLNITWKIPAPDGVCNGLNGDLRNHLIEYRTSSQLVAKQLNTNSNHLSYLLTGLTPFTAYHVRVAFVNNHGVGSFSQEVSGTTSEASRPTAPPNNFEVESYGTGKIAVYFTAPVKSSRNGVIVGYEVICQGLNETIPHLLTHRTELSTITGFLPNTHYECSISACNSIGCGPATRRKAVYASERTLPNLPESLVITSAGSHQVTFTYVPPDGIEELLLTLFYIYPLTPNIPRELSYTLSNSTNQHTLEQLDAAIKYTVKLAGVNKDGIGFNRTGVVTLPPGRPSTPNISLNMYDERKVCITWTVLHDGGSTITESTLQKKFPTDNSNSWVPFATVSPYNGSYQINISVTTLEIRIVIYNEYGSAASSPVILSPPTSEENTSSSTTLIIILVVVMVIVICLSVLLIVCVIVSYLCRRERKKESLDIRGETKIFVEEESNIFRNLNEHSDDEKRTSFPHPSESSSDCTDNNPPPSYHSNFPSKDSKVSIGSKSSKSSDSSRHKVEISERKQDPITKGVLAQPRKVQSTKFPHKTVVFVEHQTQSSIDSDSTEPSQASWTNTFNRHIRDSPIPILEESSPPLPPKRHTNKQPHPLTFTANPGNVVHAKTNSDVWDGIQPESLTNLSNYPIHLISHKKSRSDELSDHYRYEDPSEILPSTVVKSRGKPAHREKPQPTRSKSPIGYLAQKLTLSPTKSKDRSTPVSPETPDPRLRTPSPSFDETTLADTVFSDSLRKSRVSYPVFHQHQHTGSNVSQPTSSQPSFC